MHSWSLSGELSVMERTKMDYHRAELQEYEDAGQRYIEFKEMAIRQIVYQIYRGTMQLNGWINLKLILISYDSQCNSK